MNERIEELIGKKNIEKIAQKHILIVGVGGVGGTALEALVRSGIKKITIIDNDVFECSNLNRQILTTTKTLGKNKVEIAAKRMKEINPEIQIKTHDVFLKNENIHILEQYDYIIDACDTISTKIALIQYAQDNNIKIISSMGTGKRLNPNKLKISTLDKTFNDPLAKIMRKKIKDAQIRIKIPVVFSEELPQNQKQVIGSMIFVPSTAGLLLAYYVIEDIIKETNI